MVRELAQRATFNLSHSVFCPDSFFHLFIPNWNKMQSTRVLNLRRRKGQEQPESVTTMTADSLSLDFGGDREERAACFAHQRELSGPSREDAGEVWKRVFKIGTIVSRVSKTFRISMERGGLPVSSKINNKNRSIFFLSL